jgi:hypothetical protein
MTTIDVHAHVGTPEADALGASPVWVPDRRAHEDAR